MTVRRIIVAVVFILAAAVPVRPDPSSTRLQNVEQWLKATLSHEPGMSDGAVMRIAAWPDSELRTLWVDLNALVALMRDTKLTGFIVRPDARSEGQKIRYTGPELHRLRLLACAGAGKATAASIVRNVFAEPVCAEAFFWVDPELRLLSELAQASRRRGDDNYVLRRAAILHADIAMAGLALRDPGSADSAPKASRSVAAPQQLRVDVHDGRQIGVRSVAIHWIIGRMLLDDVRAAGEKKPSPGRDEMVRRWYRATAAWMQLRQDHDTFHLAHARRLFPSDADILFLSACQREALAAPRIQEVLHSLVVPTGFSIDVQTDRPELRRAAEYFRQALAAKPDFAEARLRLGRVESLLGQHPEAVRELRHAIAATDDPLILYYGGLFFGAVQEALGDLTAARESYDRSAALYPRAQSPLLALSELAWRTGDRAGALKLVQRLFELRAAGDTGADDPWWTYHVAQARDTDALVDAMYEPFRALDAR